MITQLAVRNYAADLRGGAAVCVLVALAAVAGMAWSRAELRGKFPPLEADSPLYLPEIEKVKLVTLGFDNVLGDILWFNTINYFGKQAERNRDLKWLGHMCTLVTDLDPRARHAVEFCSTMLSWIAREPQLSDQLLTKAIAADPDYWRLHYLRGFTRWYFLEDRANAQKDLVHASHFPDAPVFLSSLASRMMAQDASPQMAIGYLKDLLQRTQDQNARKALEDQIKLGYMSSDFQILDAKLKEYERTHGKRAADLSELVTAGMLGNIPRDPFGGNYFLDAESGELKSTSGQRGLKFFGKTAETGLARFEPKR